MDVQVKYVVCGVDEAGFGWHLPTQYENVGVAALRAEFEADNNPEVWVEKHTLTREIVKSISGPGLPETALIPA